MRQLLGLMPNTKQRRRGNAFAKGSPPYGLWLGPKLFDKEPQRWHGQSTSTKCLAARVEKYLASMKTIFKLLTVPLKSESAFPFVFYF